VTGLALLKAARKVTELPSTSAAEVGVVFVAIIGAGADATPAIPISQYPAYPFSTVGGARILKSNLIAATFFANVVPFVPVRVIRVEDCTGPGKVGLKSTSAIGLKVVGLATVE